MRCSIAPASKLNVATLICAVFANAQAKLATCCSLKPPSRHSEAFANRVKSFFLSDCSAVDNAQTVLERSRELKSITNRSAACAIATKVSQSAWPTLANAHNVFANSYELNSPVRCIAEHAKDIKSFSVDWSALANAQAKLAMLYASKLSAEF
eukprot:gnl/TRDRNA2_/TRDRNA2_171896_c4_seq18.p1 gnl/TRDRNA2_/TRDRNA2_171896_c4~~gnl/TRDRNA2_/TRDRNA2_171896_c4_seq18.p1  ORF type:complete len:153 (-),score=24.73 gnl/TRDRNA2_/TRDRNA2_171896_c4_seq18:139-597(-)